MAALNVEYHHKFNPQFPEDYQWGTIDQITLSDIATELSSEVHTDLKVLGHNLTPGLRTALKIIAKYAKVYITD